MKHRFKSAQMGPPPEGYMGRGKKGSECALTGEWEMTSKLEVDHKHGHMSLSSVEDILEFILHLLSSNSEELQLVSKDAHKIKSYAERMGITFEDAVIEKQVIAFGKLTGAEQRAILSTHDVGKVEASTAKKRKDLYRNILKEGK